ncbi:hypothetical protein [Nonlabens xiamenensis]|uniref:hypothetical protein n=1 Tax=Nonlabens xiamenensis TaxID=2341043 RepID=UPI000F605464|nr:hypothetical protein [Nonlabens xiamenensis]
MNEIIQNNIKFSDLAYDVKLRIDFLEQVTESDLDAIDSELSTGLMKLGIGFDSAHGINFISAALLDFGESPKFSDLRKCVNEVLTTYESIIKQITFNKSEFTQASFDFITEKKIEFEKILKETKSVFSKVDFKPISSSPDSPEYRHFSGSDTEETITLFISEINYDQKDWVRFSVGCKRLNENEIAALLGQINQIHPNAVQIKWNGLEYNYEIEKWELPKHYKLFELIKNESTTKPKLN